jgi:hypothetical protein
MELTLGPAREPRSPFLQWADVDTALELPAPPPPSDLAALLGHPELVCERMLEARRAPALIVTAVLAVGLSTLAFCAGVSNLVSRSIELRLLWAPVYVLAALAAATGPLYATSILLAVRLPFARLVACVLTSGVVGALLSLASLPLIYMAWVLDPDWAGSLTLLSAFGLGAIAAASRLRTLLLTLAGLNQPDTKMAAGDEFRVRMLARISVMGLGFALVNAIWALERLW